jgi:hypothetical protein
MDPNNYQPIISYELLHAAVTSMIIGCFAFAILTYLGPPVLRWFRGLFHMDNDRLPALPTWDFGPELSHVTVLDNPVASSNNRPYDWALEDDGYHN